MQDGNTVTPAQDATQAPVEQVAVQPNEGEKTLAQRLKERNRQFTNPSPTPQPVQSGEPSSEAPKVLDEIEDIKPTEQPKPNASQNSNQDSSAKEVKPTPREHKIEDDIRILSASGKSKEDIDAYINAITPIDLSEYNAEQMAAVYARYKLPESYTDEDVQAYLEQKFGDNKAGLTDYAETGRSEMAKELDEARKEAIDSLAEIREQYYNEEESYKRIEEYSKNMQNSYKQAVESDTLEVNGAVLTKNHLQHIHNSIKDDVESGNMLGMLFMDKEGNMDMQKYVDAVMRYAPHKLSPKLVDSYKKATTQKDLVQAQKQTHIDRVNMPTSRGEAPRRTHTGETKQPKSPEEVRKTVLFARKNGGRILK